MKKYRIIYALLVLGSFGLSMGYQSSLSTVIFYTVLILPFVSLLLFVVSRLTIRISTPAKTVVVQKNQEFTSSVFIRNNFIVPLAPVRIYGTFQDYGAVPKSKRVIVSVSPFNRIEVSFKGAIKYRGRYIIGAEKIEIVDLLKLFRFTIKLGSATEAIVIPRRLSPEAVNQEDCDNESHKTSLTFFENNTFSSVRKYRDGDNLRHVHWKLSAKHDDLVVRQMEQNLNSKGIIFFDLNSYGSTRAENAAAGDVILETVLAVTDRILKDGNSVYEVFCDPDDRTPVNIEIADSEDYERLYGMCSVIPFMDDRVPFTETLNCFTELLASASKVYVISACADEDIIARALEMSTVTNNAVSLLFVKNRMNAEITENMALSAGVRTHLLDESNLLASINEALE